MTIRDLSAYFEDDGLEYADIPSDKHPGGKTYRVPCVDARTGLWLTSLTDVGLKAAVGGQLTDREVAALKLDDEGEKSLYQRVLGPVYDEMVADGVSWSLLQRIATDAFLCFAINQDAADAALARTVEAVGEAPAAPESATSTPPTRPATDGSSSGRGRTAIQDQARARTSSRLSSRNPAKKKTA